jgi:catechol 2,3-dioxygenase-like lactoylglutathione lyase family enzyme
MRARFAHTNLIAQDWRALAAFYVRVFGCEVLAPERDYQSRELDAGTGLEGAHLTGAHLRLPGESKVTLEVYQYDAMVERPATVINRPGLGHIAFEVDDVKAALVEVRSHGGGAVGEVVTVTTKTGGKVTWVYATDPEGNVVELQSWS